MDKDSSTILATALSRQMDSLISTITETLLRQGLTMSDIVDNQRDNRHKIDSLKSQTTSLTQAIGDLSKEIKDCKRLLQALMDFHRGQASKSIASKYKKID